MYILEGGEGLFCLLFQIWLWLCCLDWLVGGFHSIGAFSFQVSQICWRSFLHFFPDKVMLAHSLDAHFLKGCHVMSPSSIAVSTTWCFGRRPQLYTHPKALETASRLALFGPINLSAWGTYGCAARSWSTFLFFIHITFIFPQAVDRLEWARKTFGNLNLL